MRTDQINNTTFIHHGDFSGSVKIVSKGGELEVPFVDIKEFVARYVRMEKISKLEDASDDDILFR